MSFPADFFQGAFAKLQSISTELPKWPGGGGRLASSRVAAGVTAFLTSAHEHQLPEPEIGLRRDGSVDVIWQDKAGWYIQIEILEIGRYLFSITFVPANFDSPVADSIIMITGVSESMLVTPGLVENVKKVGISE